MSNVYPTAESGAVKSMPQTVNSSNLGKPTVSSSVPASSPGTTPVKQPALEWDTQPFNPYGMAIPAATTLMGLVSAYAASARDKETGKKKNLLRNMAIFGGLGAFLGYKGRPLALLGNKFTQSLYSMGLLQLNNMQPGAKRTQGDIDSSRKYLTDKLWNAMKRQKWFDSVFNARLPDVSESNKASSIDRTIKQYLERQKTLKNTIRTNKPTR